MDPASLAVVAAVALVGLLASTSFALRVRHLRLPTAAVLFVASTHGVLPLAGAMDDWCLLLNHS